MNDFYDIFHSSLQKDKKLFDLKLGISANFPRKKPLSETVGNFFERNKNTENDLKESKLKNELKVENEDETERSKHYRQNHNKTNNLLKINDLETNQNNKEIYNIYQKSENNINTQKNKKIYNYISDECKNSLEEDLNEIEKKLKIDIKKLIKDLKTLCKENQNTENFFKISINNYIFQNSPISFISDNFLKNEIGSQTENNQNKPMEKVEKVEKIEKITASVNDYLSSIYNKVIKSDTIKHKKQKNANKLVSFNAPQDDNRKIVENNLQNIYESAIQNCLAKQPKKKEGKVVKNYLDDLYDKTIVNNVEKNEEKIKENNDFSKFDYYFNDDKLINRNMKLEDFVSFSMNKVLVDTLFCLIKTKIRNSDK